jgi:hypothetical protein
MPYSFQGGSLQTGRVIQSTTCNGVILAVVQPSTCSIAYEPAFDGISTSCQRPGHPLRMTEHWLQGIGHREGFVNKGRAIVDLREVNINLLAEIFQLTLRSDLLFVVKPHAPVIFQRYFCHQTLYVPGGTPLLQ